jgi:hypothetical protein
VGLVDWSRAGERCTYGVVYKIVVVKFVLCCAAAVVVRVRDWQFSLCAPAWQRRDLATRLWRHIYHKHYNPSKESARTHSLSRQNKHAKRDHSLPHSNHRVASTALTALLSVVSTLANSCLSSRSPSLVRHSPGFPRHHRQLARTPLPPPAAIALQPHTTRSSRACSPIASTFERRRIGYSLWLRLWPQPPRQCRPDPRRGGSRPPTPILGRCDVCLPT